MLISEKEYLESTKAVLTAFVDATSGCLTEDKSEYSKWILNARAALADADFSVDTLVRKKQVFLLNLARFIESPSRGFSDILNSENLPEERMKDYHDIFSTHQMSFEFVPNPRRARVAEFRTNVTRGLRDVFRQLGSPMPAPYQKLYFDDAGRKFVKNTIVSLTGRGDDASVAIATVIQEHWPSIVGCAQAPISEHLKCAVIWHGQEGRSVLAVTSEGQPVYLLVPGSMANTNEAALRICEREVINVLSGHPATLVSGRYSLATEILTRPVPMEQSADVNEYGQRRARQARAFVDISSPISDAVMKQIREAVLPLRTSERVFQDGSLSHAYARPFMSLNLRLDEARLRLEDALEPAARVFLSQMGMADLTTIAWFTGAPGILPNAHHVRIRNDAEDAFFATGPLFYVAKTKEVQDAVCERAPILPLVRNITGLTKAQINVISAMPAPSRPDEVLTSFPPFDPEVMRGRVLKDLAAATRVFEVLQKANPEKKPQGLAADAAKVFDEGVMRDVRDVKDVIVALEDKLITPMCISMHGEIVGSSQDFLRSLFYPKTLSRMISVNETYHEERLWEELENSGREQLMAAWAPLTQAKLCAGLGVRELTSTEQIRVQGRKQSHCVGGYAAYVLSGREILLSVDEEGGMPHSTVEVILRDKSGQLSLENVQHRAAYNRAPSQQAVMAVREFLHQSLTEARAGLTNYLNGLKDAKRSAIRIRQGSPEHSFRVLSSILPQKLVDAGYDAVFQLAVQKFERSQADLENKSLGDVSGCEPNL